MGYYMDMTDANIFIKKENEKDALNAVKAAVSDGKVNAWVSKKYVEDSNNLFDAMNACRWCLEDSPDGDGYCYIYFDGEKLGDDFQLFKSIAPYVEDNGYIEMNGEDGEMWRWVFKNGECREIYPTVVWDCSY